MNLPLISWKNLWARPWSTAMSLLLFAMGVGIISLLMMLQASLDNGLNKNIRGIDMVIGAKGSPLQLILSSVYHIDNPTGNISFSDAKKISKNPLVKRGIPLAYGDNYKGYKILGTTHAYLDLYQGSLTQGELWKKPFEVVIGGVLAERENINLGDKLISSHGAAQEAPAHEEHPFIVVGILAKSGTVLDQLVLTAYESIWHVHDDHQKEENTEHEEHGEHESGQDITAMLIEFRGPMGMMQLPRMVNSTTNMQAALPVIEVKRLFKLFAVGIQLIQGIAIAIMVISAISIFISLYTNLRDRTYELALMRSLGASTGELFFLVLMEGIFISLIGFFTGILLSRVGMWIIGFLIEANYRYDLDVLQTLREEGFLLMASLIVGFLAALIPALQAVNTDIAEALTD